MFIAGLGTAVPSRCYTQRECWEAVQASRCWESLEPRSQAILKKVLTGSNGIGTRHLALEDLEAAFSMDPDTLHARFKRTAPELAAAAAQRALADAGVEARAVDAMLISTCTGYLCPGLTSYVSERLGLRGDALLLDLVGQGCGAALPNLATGRSLVRSGEAGAVLSICVEVCSAAMYLDNDPGVLISACLFGDGAGAAVLSGQRSRSHSIEWKAGRSLLDAADRELLRFDQKNGMLRNVLALRVPKVASGHAATVAGQLFEEAGLDRGQVTGWILHPGGKEVLSALRQELGLRETDTRWSAAVLEAYGNVSSASVFFVMEAALRDSGRPGYWYMSSFGAGFSCHGAMLEVKG